MLSKLEELSLIARCLTADSHAAYAELVAAYQDGLRGFLINLTLGDAMLTDDLAQDTFLKAYLNLRSFQGVSKFSTWLYRIAYNEFISYKRKFYRDQAEQPENMPEKSSESYRQYDLSHDLAQAMTVLNDNERAVITLFYLQEMPIKKISGILDINEGTIKSLLSRARKKMKDILQDYE